MSSSCTTSIIGAITWNSCLLNLLKKVKPKLLLVALATELTIKSYVVWYYSCLKWMQRKKSYDSRPNVSTLVHFLHQGWSKAATRIIFSLDLPISVNSYWGAMAAQKLGKTSLMRINGQLVSVCKKTNGFRSSLIKTLGSSFERLGGGIAIFGFAVSAIFLFLGRISVLTPVACCFCSISLSVPRIWQEKLSIEISCVWISWIWLSCIRI